MCSSSDTDKSYLPSKRELVTIRRMHVHKKITVLYSYNNNKLDHPFNFILSVLAKPAENAVTQL